MTARNIARRVGAAAILVAQLLLIVRGYSADHAVFGFQMFPASSEWQATIERELANGDRVDVREDWPGGYSWSELVAGYGLGQPFARHHADTGLVSTLHFFSAALEWVAVNTPLDTEAVLLIATVTVWPNGRNSSTVVFEASR